MDEQDIDSNLRGLLPDVPADLTAALSRLLADAVQGALSPTEVHSLIARDVRATETIRRLAGRELRVGKSVISFGEGNRVGSVSIGKVAGGDLVEINLNQGKPTGVPFQAPALSRFFVPRPEVSESLKARLFSNEATPGALVVSAIHGLGGIGKSTLIAALAHDPEVLRRFTDGILWNTLGQHPDILSLLSVWIHALGDYDFRPTNVMAASAYLRGMLRNKATLIVVDDAWDASHVEPFVVGGSLCRVVITTRDALIAKAVGAALYNLDVMAPDQALTLIKRRLGRELGPKERAFAFALSEDVGYLPLALELGASQIADGTAWEELLGDLKSEIARLEVLQVEGWEEVEDESLRKKLSVLASFHLSLRRLSPERLKRFGWLGILREDATITAPMVATLWGVDNRLARDELRIFRDKSLLLPGDVAVNSTTTFRLHDLIRELALRILTTPTVRDPGSGLPGLGFTLPEAQRGIPRTPPSEVADGTVAYDRR